MGKFKVGDVVRFKSKEELMKITYFELWKPNYKLLAGKTVKIYEVLEYNNYAIQDGHCVLKPCFPEYYFEDADVLVEI